MDRLQGKFSDFDAFKEVIKDWTLDYNILSKGDFSSKFNMFMSEPFLLTRQQLNGKIVHSGMAPNGYRTMVIPVNYLVEFVWYNSKVSGRDLLIFPKNNLIDVVTFNGLDIFLVSVQESLLHGIIEKLGLKTCEHIFKQDYLKVPLSKEFAKQFFVLANTFLNTAKVNVEQQYELSNKLVFALLYYLESTSVKQPKKKAKNKMLALERAIEVIHNQTDRLYSVSEVCEISGVSKRTLFNAFKEKYKISPSEYIKVTRLNMVKEDLIHNPTVGIGSVAGKYHFWHMGQFAKDFKKQFGLLPSEVRL